MNTNMTNEICKIHKTQIIGSSETPRAVCSKNISNINTLSRRKTLTNLQFSYWLAGLIDGDGSLLVSKSGYTSCEITVSTKELPVLNKVKARLNGAIKPRTKTNACRWRLHNKKGMHLLLDFIDGKLLLEKRQEQYKQVCLALGRLPLLSKKISKRNHWITGFYEAEGEFNVNKTTLQCTITLSQKDCTLLQEIQNVMGGKIYYIESLHRWLYSASSLTDIEQWVKYFSTHLLCSWKQVQLQRFKRVLLYKSRGVHLIGYNKKRSVKRLRQLLKQFHDKRI